MTSVILAYFNDKVYRDMYSKLTYLDLEELAHL